MYSNDMNCRLVLTCLDFETVNCNRILVSKSGISNASIYINVRQKLVIVPASVRLVTRTIVVVNIDLFSFSL